MKRLVLCLICLVASLSMTAQMYVWKNGNIILQMPTERPDSITFTNPWGRHKFSVSPTQQVLFSRGNLQLNDYSFTWRFAENQYDIIGTSNFFIAPLYDGWIDLFGWGCSGYNGMEGSLTSEDYRDYIIDGNWQNSLVGSHAWADWGVFNAIENGGNTEGMWRTLTAAEWSYLLLTRSHAAQLAGLAVVNNQKGLLLMPDQWQQPEDVPFRPIAESSMILQNGFYQDDDFIEDHYLENMYDLDLWKKLENSGAIFLPAAGYRSGTNTANINSWGYYWSTTAGAQERNGNVCALFFFGWGITPQAEIQRYRGASVRLVQDVQ